MKKFGLIFLGVILIIALIFFGKSENSEGNNDYLRIHIRANSNESVDQEIKYRLKDEVVKYLTPIVSTCSKKEEAIQKISENLENIEAVCNQYLLKNGFTYQSKAKIKKEEFPTRCYEDFILEEGVYDALIINLGSGEGNNWWCVVYPPLCFVGAVSENENFEYRSKIYEIINEFRKRNKS